MNRLTAFLLPIPFALVASACSGETPVPPEPSTATDAIVGGATDSSNTFPNVVMLGLPGGSACTGSLIAPKLVLTARHCVSQNITEGIGCDIYGNSTNGDHVGSDHAASGIKVFTGITPKYWGTPVAVGTQIFHPPGKNLCNNDIALVVLNTAVAGVTPLKIRLDYGPQTGEQMTAVGYGITSDGAFNSGTRRRRSNVPVITVGQDWNELVGAGEFAAGQSICSGDSGGPVVSAGGAVLGVASRSQNCSNPADHPKFTRVDFHKNLILQAFAAAGGSPSLEGGSAPPPPVKKQTGEGPCTTGAECASFLCKTGAGSICTQFCSSGNCPVGTVCADTNIVISGQTIKDKVCTTLSGGNACEQCRNAQCVNVVTSCLNNSSCDALLKCVDSCGTQGCIDSCIAANPAGADDYDLLRYCSCEGGCATDCAHMCPATGTGGAGGGTSTGGAAGTAGTSGAGAVPSGGAGGAAGGTNPMPTSTSGSSGGCSVSPTRSSIPLWMLVALVPLVRRRRRA